MQRGLRKKNVRNRIRFLDTLFRKCCVINKCHSYKIQIYIYSNKNIFAFINYLYLIHQVIVTTRNCYKNEQGIFESKKRRIMKKKETHQNLQNPSNSLDDPNLFLFSLLKCSAGESSAAGARTAPPIRTRSSTAAQISASLGTAVTRPWNVPRNRRSMKYPRSIFLV